MIAFVVGGGGNRGPLEGGALLGLFEAGIIPDILVGTSAGSLNAAVLATDPTLEGARRLASTCARLRREDFFPGSTASMLWRLARGRSLFSRTALRASLEKRLPRDKRNFGDLQGVRLYITAANLTTGTLYLYGDRPDALLIDAVLASTAHPLAYPPVRMGKYQLVDGGVVANVPVGIAAERGATEIYVLNVGYHGELGTQSWNLLQVLLRSIALMQYQHFLMDLRYVLETTDIVVHHIAIKGFEHSSMWDFNHAADMVELGRQQALEYLKSPTGLDSVPIDVFGESTKEMEPVPRGAEVYVPACFRPSDLLALPGTERQITRYLSRQGEADPSTLAVALGRTVAQIRIELSSLVKKGYVQRLPDGEVRLVFGRRRHRGLPDQLWEALGAEAEAAPV